MKFLFCEALYQFQGPQECVLQEARPGAPQEPRPQRRQGERAEGVAQDGRRGGQQGRITNINISHGLGICTHTHWFIRDSVQICLEVSP